MHTTGLDSGWLQRASQVSQPQQRPGTTRKRRASGLLHRSFIRRTLHGQHIAHRLNLWLLSSISNPYASCDFTVASLSVPPKVEDGVAQCVHIVHYHVVASDAASVAPGMDLLQCTADDLKGIVKGPPCRRETVANAVSEFTRMGGIPRYLLQSWGTVDVSTPLPTQGAAHVVAVKPEPFTGPAAHGNGR